MLGNTCVAVHNKNKAKKLVEVILCKDCDYWVSDGGAMMMCALTQALCNEDDFCSYGEWKKEETK